jgi:CRISPR-associated protein Csx17
MPHTAAALRRHSAGAAPDAALLGAELADHWWLASLRRHARAREAPAALRDAIRVLEDALFESAALPGQNGSGAADRAQEVLIAYGRLGRVLANRPKLRDALSPPPLLSARWAETADDGSIEFRVAAALAGLRAKLAGVEENGAEVPSEPAAENRPRYGLYMRQHLAPLDADPRRRRYPAWDTEAGAALAVWGPGSLIDNLCAVAQRRLLEAHRFADKPFDAPFGADSEAIGAFLQGAESVHRRVAALVAGLAWVEPARPRGSSPVYALPLAFAAMKPLFARDDALRAARRSLPETFALPAPSALPGLLTADRVDEAVHLAMARARNSGLPTPFMHAQLSNASPNYGRRLLAALTIPVTNRVLRSCLDQAYPSDEETEHAA